MALIPFTVKTAADSGASSPGVVQDLKPRATGGFLADAAGAASSGIDVVSPPDITGSSRYGVIGASTTCEVSGAPSLEVAGTPPPGAAASSPEVGVATTVGTSSTEAGASSSEG